MSERLRSFRSKVAEKVGRGKKDPQFPSRPEPTLIESEWASLLLSPQTARDTRRVAEAKGIHEQEALDQMVEFVAHVLADVADGNSSLFQFDKRTGTIRQIEVLPDQAYLDTADLDETDDDNLVHFPVERRLGK